MATEARSPNTTRDRGRVRYRFTGDQVLKMVELGIIPETTRIELWDGVIYWMTKHEPHNFSVAEVADALRRVVPDGYHVREEKSARRGAYSLPEPDVAVARGA